MKNSLYTNFYVGAFVRLFVEMEFDAAPARCWKRRKEEMLIQMNAR